MKGSALFALRSAALLAILLGLALTGGARAYDIPQLWGCHWPELESVTGRISYDMSEGPVEWRQGVENWDTPLDWLMHFDVVYYPNGQTHLVWEEEEPLYFDCDPGDPHFLYACWRPVDLADCDDNILSRAAINFRRSSYVSLGDNERIAVSAHEWGHNLDLGHTPGYFCDNQPRVMAELGPDGEGCITGPSCAEQAAMLDYYDLIPWWHDRDGDCWDNDDEVYIGTSAWDDCPDNPSDDAWPPDIDNSTKVHLVDALLFKPHMRCSIGDDCYDSRFDLSADGWINLQDVLMLKPYMGTSCTQ